MLKTADINADSNLLSILLCHKAKTLPWIVSNFINFFIDKNEGWDEIYGYDFWYGCPWIYDNVIRKEIFEFILKDNYRYSDFLCDSIDRDYGIYTIVNMKPIRLYQCNYDENHNLFIYGYDKSKKVFYITEFINQIYSKYIISFDEMNEGYRTLCNVNNGEDPNYGTRLIKFKENVSYTFSIEQIIKKIDEHLSSINLFWKNDGAIFYMDSKRYDDYAFGLDYYDALSDIVSTRVFEKTRAFHLLVFRNEIEKIRLDYLISNHYVPDDKNLSEILQELCQQSLHLQNAFIKSLLSLSHDNETICKRIKKIKDLDFSYYSILKKYLVEKTYIFQ